MATEAFSLSIVKDRLFFAILESKPKFLNSGSLQIDNTPTATTRSSPPSSPPETTPTLTTSPPTSSSDPTASPSATAQRSVSSPPSKNNCWIHTSDIYEYLYFPFAYDFGPPSIAQVYRFVKTINKLLKFEKKIVFYSLITDSKNCTNAVFLMGSYCIFSLGWTATKTTEAFSALDGFLEFYRDASDGPPTYGLKMAPCFHAMEKAKRLGWINLETFNFQEYTFYEQVENGDFNWIIPDKFIAMCSPTATEKRTETTVTHTVEYYLPYFKEHNVSTVIRLNTAEYDRQSFVKAGIDHQDMYFVDGTVPPMSIVEKFLKVVENASGTIAVHCKQGLGRTGSLIACYIMKHYDFDAAESIAFLRIQRPGSVVGPQQQFLHKMEPAMKALGVVINSPGSKREDSVTTRSTLKSNTMSPPVVTGMKKRTPVKVS